ncbi:uncharacterized protein [Rutidosis leptorrhynchoides]|uniref:uncharacterized protein n=1 Tax=Rutidosis leptorrhynchoides TaxID=125765 RepID=UPI003A9925A2
MPELVTEVDEIKNYLDRRYLSPCEAVWRMFSFDIHFSKPSVIKLSYHLPNHHTITLRDSNNLPALLHRESIKETMFTEWFELNKRDPSARNLTYAKIPKNYVWNQDAKTWTRQKHGSFIGLIVYLHPASDERYYLRLLLNKVKGPQTYEEIRTVDGTLHPTFKDACFAYGLINDDREWTTVITEARLWASGTQLRDLFVTILLFCNVTKPLTLWELNWEALAEDILYKKRKLYNFPDLILSESQLRNYCLLEIQDILNKHGIASLLLPGGQTAHSRFVIPLELMENSTCGIKQKTHLAELMQEVRLIIWDEAPMTQRFAFEALDKTLKDILGAKMRRTEANYLAEYLFYLVVIFDKYCPLYQKERDRKLCKPA